MRSPRLLVATAALALLVGAPALGAAKKPPLKKHTTYTGTTSQGSICRDNGVDNTPCTVSVRTSKNGKKVAELVIKFGAPCTDNTKFFRSDTRFTGVPITKKAKFHNASSYDEPIAGGATAHDTVTLHGKFKRKHKKFRVAGDYSVVSDLTFSDGSTTHCESGPVTWSAKP